MNDTFPHAVAYAPKEIVTRRQNYFLAVPNVFTYSSDLTHLFRACLSSSHHKSGSLELCINMMALKFDQVAFDICSSEQMGLRYMKGLHNTHTFYLIRKG